MIFLQKNDQAIRQLYPLRLLGMKRVQGRDWNLLPGLWGRTGGSTLCLVGRCGSDWPNDAASKRKERGKSSDRLRWPNLIAGLLWLPGLLRVFAFQSWQRCGYSQ